jgi:hypothetical protein
MSFLSVLFQVEPGWFGPGLAALVTFLSVPAVASLATSAIRWLTNTGINPRAIVWVVAVAVTGVAYSQDWAGLPPLDLDNIPAYVSSLLLLATGFAEFAKVMYDRIRAALPVVDGS